MPLLSQEWLASLTAVSAPGESLKYDEDYVDLKNKMSQVTFDSESMVELAARLLTRSYDWQLCQFLLLACAAGGYLNDFLCALKAYETILEKGDLSYPQTSKGRQSTLYWLNQSNIIDLLSQHKDKMTEDWLTQCKLTWAAMQSSWKHFFEQDHLSWHALGKWLEQCKPASVSTESNVVQTLAHEAETVKSLENDNQASEQLHDLWEYYWKKGSKLKAMCLSRSDAWARITLPVEQYGNTWVSPLRPADHQQMHALYSQSQWEALWEFAESCFMQQGGPFDVRLQYAIIESLTHMNRPDLLMWAKSFFITWMQVFPGLLAMHFNDGTPFCDASVRSWAVGLNAPAIEMDEQCDLTLFESTEVLVRQRKSDAMDGLKVFVAVSYSDQIWQRYLFVLFDYVSHKIEQAWRGYQALIALCEKRELLYWDKKLMHKIWLLGVEMSEKKGVKYEQIINQIIQHDFLFAGSLAH